MNSYLVKYRLQVVVQVVDQSKFSFFTKCKIKEKSGLNYEMKDEKVRKVSDAILLALDKHQALHSKWIEILGNDIEVSGELLSKPGPESFLDLQQTN